jgi:hypothetical protein
MALIPVSDTDGSWQRLKEQWRAECTQFDEEFDAYASGTFSVLDPLAADGHPRCGIYALAGPDHSHPAFCQVNRTPLPGHPAPVVRVRMMTFSPKYDYGEFEIQEYAQILMGLFSGVIQLSDTIMESREIKFHLRSIADRQFFAALSAPLSSHRLFQAVEVKGMWLYVTKS